MQEMNKCIEENTPIGYKKNCSPDVGFLFVAFSIDISMELKSLEMCVDK